MPIDLEAAAADIRAAGDSRVSIEFDAPQALAMLGILQLAMRHPSADESYAWEVARNSALVLERFLTSLGPNLAAMAAAGWNPDKDQ
jgi:hypothetical protein